jgi:hypothetical protein
MILDFILLADAADVGDDGKLHVVGGGITRVNPQSLPAVLPRVVAVARFIFEEERDGEQTRDIQFRWQHVETGRELMAPLGGPVALGELAGPSYSAVEGEERGIFVLAEFNGLRFSEPGEHRLSVHVDSEVVGYRPVVVIEQATDESPSADS